MMTTETLQTLLSISLVSLFLTGYYTPINPAREWLTEKWVSFFVRRKMYKTAEVALVFNCGKCMAFVVTLLYTWNLIYAIIASIFTLLLKYITTYVSKNQ